MPVPYLPLRKVDLDDPSLSSMNMIVRTHTDELNRLGGLNGPVEIIAPIDAGGNKITGGSFSFNGTASLLMGNGSPVGKVAAALGSLYLNLLGGAKQTLWVKESGGSTNQGWTPK